ncbi:MAG: WD40/YVTN/BNR-like repeat-containing protein [Chloroflexota bacterium]
MAKNDRYILNLSFKSLQFVSNDTLIAVGKYSLICMSYNGGVEWEIKSDISGVSWISLIDENTIKAFGPYGKFFHSDDGGATWLPQKNYIQSVAEEEKFFNPLNGGSFGFKDNLNGYIYVEPFMSKEVNAVLTTDGGNTAQPKLIKNLDVSFFRTFSIPYNDNYVFCSSGSYQLGWWAVVFQLDDTLGIQQKTALPHRQFFYLTQFEGNIYALGKDSADAEDIYSIYKSTNGGKDWDKDFSFETVKPIYLAPMEIILINDDIYANWHSSAPKGEDSVLIQNYFKISLSQKSAKKILELEAAGLHKTFFVRDNWYIPYYDIDDKGIIHRGMKKSIDINASEIVWEESINKRYTSPIRQSSLLDSIMVIATYDSLFKSNQIFLAKPKGNTGIADRPRRERVKEIALSGPLASSPAGEYQFNVALDEKNVAEKLTLSAYDVRGSRVDSDFLFTPSEGNRGRLLWKPGKLPPGAYVLILKCGSAVGSATVVVE